jgi:hypothetical protein
MRRHVSQQAHRRPTGDSAGQTGADAEIDVVVGPGQLLVEAPDGIAHLTTEQLARHTHRRGLGRSPRAGYPLRY